MGFLISLVTLVLVIAVVGFLVYLITEHIPMHPVFKQAIIVGCVIVIVLYLLALLASRAPWPVLPSLH